MLAAQSARIRLIAILLLSALESTRILPIGAEPAYSAAGMPILMAGLNDAAYS